tara:strand:- start:257 stop:463 length:207 start_codon:yes stop_codon:yes gene_type:complete
MRITLLDMFKEMNSFTPCKDYFMKASHSPITTANNKAFKALTKDWSEGVYDEDPDVLLREFIALLAFD